MKNFYKIAPVALMWLSGCSTPTATNPEPAASTPPASPPASAAAPSRPAARDAAPIERSAPVERSAPAPITLASGTTLKVRTAGALSTKSAEEGERFTATLAEPLIQDDRVIAPKGAQVDGKVVASDDGGKVKGLASIAVALTALHTSSGVVPISTSTVGREARASKKKDAVKVGIGAGIGAAIGAIAGGGKGAAIGSVAGAGAGTGVVMATKGDPAVIPAESLLTFKLRAAATLPAQ